MQGNKEYPDDETVKLPEDYQISLISIDVDRDDDGEIRGYCFHFRLHVEDGGYSHFPVTVTENPGSLDESLRVGRSILYEMLARLAERLRRTAGYPKLKFE
jgi:hypothetical protein